jgi:hypothetical protein
MRRLHYFSWKQRKGIALLLVMFIAFASLVLLTTLLASVAPRRASVSGEAQADRALAVADGKIDLVMDTINTLPQINVSGLADENDIQGQIIAGWEGMLNGYDVVSGPNSLDNASNVATYFYRISSDTWYAVWNSTDTPQHLMSIQSGIKLGHEVGPTDSTSGTVLAWVGLKNLSTGGVETTSSVIGIDLNCRTDNDWFEVDTNAVYNVVPTDVWTITASAYLLSRTGIVKTVEAKADKSFTITPTEDPSSSVIYNWFTRISRSGSFSDYVFLDDFDVNFGKNSTVYGYVHANGTVNMGGWAVYPVSSTEHVTDIAVDDNNRSDGRFGPAKGSLSWAKAHTLNGDKYAEDNADAIAWLKVDAALTGASVIRKPASETGMQDKAIDPPYYVNGNATITFSVEGSPSTGKVTINSTKYDLPPNGIIYVEGDATVKGNVLGRCMVGAHGNISIAGDILYNTPPRTAESDPSTSNPDFLGLVSKGNIKIPYSTYQADKHLIIDSAMVADGWLGTDPNEWQWHNLNTDPSTAPTLVVRGSLAAGDGSHLMATTSNGQIKGYDLRQYNFDWNLKQVGVPAGFPTTGSTTTSMETIVSLQSMQDFGIVSSETEYAALLAQLTNPSSHPDGSSLTVNGRAYYAKATTVPGPSTWEGTGFVTSGMYRIGWKEQIGEPVAPAP